MIRYLSSYTLAIAHSYDVGVVNGSKNDASILSLQTREKSRKSYQVCEQLHEQFCGRRSTFSTRKVV